jgi:hypothetical protein
MRVVMERCFQSYDAVPGGLLRSRASKNTHASFQSRIKLLSAEFHVAEVDAFVEAKELIPSD